MKNILIGKSTNESVCPECNGGLIDIPQGKKVCYSCGLVSEESNVSFEQRKAYTPEEIRTRRHYEVMPRRLNPNRIKRINGRTIDGEGWEEQARYVLATRIKTVNPEIPNFIFETAMYIFKNVAQKNKLNAGKSIKDVADACSSIAYRIFKMPEPTGNVEYDKKNKYRAISSIIRHSDFKEYLKKNKIKIYSTEERMIDEGRSFIENVLKENPNITNYIPYGELTDSVDSILKYIADNNLLQGSSPRGIYAAVAYLIINKRKKEIGEEIKEEKKNLENRMHLTLTKTEENLLLDKLNQVKHELSKINNSLNITQDYFAKKAEKTTVTIRNAVHKLYNVLGESGLENILQYDK
ncbi:MAG: hypothetical protein PHW96_01655 [Candidatus Nanoarchaeia archaeon]|nr:hypothetical protein [Candidatus Nanoarchaeia archaeon]